MKNKRKPIGIEVKKEITAGNGYYLTIGGTSISEFVTEEEYEVETQNYVADQRRYPVPTLIKPSGENITNDTYLLIEQASIDGYSVMYPQALYTEIEISTDSTFSNPSQIAYSSTGPASLTKLVPVNLINTQVVGLVTCYVRLRNKDDVYTSPWSNTRTFVIDTVDPITKPIITTSDCYSITSSPYTPDPLNLEPHVASDWEIALDSTFTNIVFSSYYDTNNLTYIEPQNLAYNTTFFARVRYNSTSHTSDWSDPYQFTFTNVLRTPEIVYPSFTVGGARTIILKEYVPTANGITNPDVRIWKRRRNDQTGTWSSWTSQLYTYNPDGVYAVTLYYFPNNVTIREYEYEVEYVGTDPITGNQVVSCNRATGYMYLDKTQLLGSSPKLIAVTTTNYHYYTTNSGTYFNNQRRIVEYYLYGDREFTTLLNTWSSPTSSAYGRRYYTSAYWQKQYHGAVDYPMEPGKKYYLISRYYDDVTNKYSSWGRVEVLDWTNISMAFVNPQVASPLNGTINKTDNYFALTPHGAPTNLNHPLYVKLSGLIPRIGTVVNSQGVVSTTEDKYFYGILQSNNSFFKYCTSNLLPNTNYYVQLKYVADPPEFKTNWSPPVSFTTGNVISKWAHTETISVGGEHGFGVPTNPLVYYRSRITSDLNLPDPSAGLAINIVDVQTGEAVFHYNMVYNSAQYTQKYAIQVPPGTLINGRTYEVQYRYDKDNAQLIPGVPLCEDWRRKTFTVTKNDVTVQAGAYVGTMVGTQLSFFWDASQNKLIAITDDNAIQRFYLTDLNTSWNQSFFNASRRKRQAIGYDHTRDTLDISGHLTNNNPINTEHVNPFTAADSFPVRNITNISSKMYFGSCVYVEATDSYYLFFGTDTTPGNLQFAISSPAATPSTYSFIAKPTPGFYKGLVVTDGANYIYAVGGSAGSVINQNKTEKCFVYNIQSNIWLNIASMDSPGNTPKGAFVPDTTVSPKGGILLARNSYVDKPARQPFLMWYDVDKNTWDYIHASRRSGWFSLPNLVYHPSGFCISYNKNSIYYVYLGV